MLAHSRFFIMYIFAPFKSITSELRHCITCSSGFMATHICECGVYCCCAPCSFQRTYARYGRKACKYMSEKDADPEKMISCWPVHVSKWPSYIQISQNTGIWRCCQTLIVHVLKFQLFIATLTYVNRLRGCPFSRLMLISSLKEPIPNTGRNQNLQREVVDFKKNVTDLGYSS